MTANPEAISREAVVVLARGWIGTPYHHQASRRGIGADCLGLVRGVWRELYGTDAEAAPAYSRDWAEASGVETLLAAAARHLVLRSGTPPQAGDVIVFRLRPGLVAKHAAIMATPSSFIHAMEGGPVTEVALSPWWRRRVAGVFSFPKVSD
jgi:NlpC/P60 family putative phage cell wall peptidase